MDSPVTDLTASCFLAAIEEIKELPDRWAELDRLADSRVRLLDETDALFDAKPYAATAWRNASPLMQEIHREGVEP